MTFLRMYLLFAPFSTASLYDAHMLDCFFFFVGPKTFPFTAGRQHFTPIYEQSKYKYLVYVDGHCAACRYGFMMRLGSVILKVESRQVADRMWYFPLLVPYHDHVPVKADLSDLEEKIRWCREHDDECRQIGENAKQFYEKYVGKEATLDYIEMVCKQIAKRFVNPPDWWMPPPFSNVQGGKVRPPQLKKPDVPCFEDRGVSRLCIRCREDAVAEERELELAQAQKVNEKEDAATRKRRRRERMIQKARSGN
jgi:Glycosyl transferase family 90